MPPVIRILEASSIDILGLMPQRVHELKQFGFETRWDPLEADEALPFLAGSKVQRVERLWQALTEDATDLVLCSRGGYGASDLLDDIPWTELKNYPPKTLIGFSDACALMAPLVYLSGWPAIHGPMPASKLWPKPDTHLMHTLQTLIAKTRHSLRETRHSPFQECRLPLQPLSATCPPIMEGQIFGGCWSVLTNLLGTRFLPPFSEPTLLFWEDVGENPGRLIRMLNHWKHAGQLKWVSGIILGDLSQMDTSLEVMAIKQELARRLEPIPSWSCDLIGHCAENWPIPLGQMGRIEDNHFTYELVIS